MNQILTYFFMMTAIPAAAQNCKEFPITRGEAGEGIIRLCRESGVQKLYVSGEMDVQDSGNERDLRSIRNIIREMRRQTTGRFEVVTFNHGGGDVDWHQKLMMAVEDNCTGACRIETRITGYCESACSQLHLTCARGARTIMEAGAHYSEHASSGGDDCHQCDTNDKSNCNICDPSQAVTEYKERCDRLLRGRNVDVDPARRLMVGNFADELRRTGVFSSDRLVRVRPPWAEPPPAAASEAPGQTAR